MAVGDAYVFPGFLTTVFQNKLKQRPKMQRFIASTLTHYHTMLYFDPLNIYIPVENIVRKGEMACYKPFLLFLTMFSTLYGTYISFQMHFKMSSAICFSLDQSQILSSRQELSP